MTEQNGAAETVTVRWWAAAKAAAGAAEDRLPPGRLSDVLEEACRRRDPGEAAQLRQVLARCSFLADEVRVSPDGVVPAGSVVDVLPPFAGG
ncbi:MAG: MoaD/ThiS family protein [Actinomycetales bacterium]